jgi:hypothetical protein
LYPSECLFNGLLLIDGMVKRKKPADAHISSSDEKTMVFDKQTGQKSAARGKSSAARQTPYISKRIFPVTGKEHINSPPRKAKRRAQQYCADFFSCPIVAFMSVRRGSAL